MSVNLYKKKKSIDTIKTEAWILFFRYVATFMRPNMARNVFPCFDEPAYKVPFKLTVVRPKHMKAVFNMPLKSSSDPK